MIRGITYLLPFEEEISLDILPYSPVFYAAKVERRDADLKEIGLELSIAYDELAEANKILAALGVTPELNANTSAIALILSIDNGQFVQDIADGTQVLLFDMLNRPDPDKKWTMTAKLTLQNDENMDNRKIVKGEVKSVTPPIESGGAIFCDGKGKMLAVKEAVQQMRLFEADETETEKSEEEKAA